jgi:hypothetical protein
MEQFPFAVDSDSSPIVAAAGDDASSLVTASSHGSFVPTSEDDGMNSSSNQHIDDEDNVAVFANIAPEAQHPLQPQIPVTSSTPPTPSVSFNATIVELPPPTNSESSHRPVPATVSTSSATEIGGGAATTISLLSGVDALKSAGSRVTSVLSHFGYGLGNNTTSTSIQTGATRAAPSPMDSVTTHHINPRSDVIEVPPEEATIDFAYINVTDEDEVDIWLDDRHSNTNRLENTSLNRSYYENFDSVYESQRPDILTVLLANDVSPPTSLNNDDQNAPILSISEQLVDLTEKANKASAKAVEARKNGNLQAALDRHSDAAKLFHQAALLIRDQDGTLHGLLK